MGGRESASGVTAAQALSAAVAGTADTAVTAAAATRAARGRHAIVHGTAAAAGRLRAAGRCEQFRTTRTATDVSAGYAAGHATAAGGAATHSTGRATATSAATAHLAAQGAAGQAHSASATGTIVGAAVTTAFHDVPEWIFFSTARTGADVITALVTGITAVRRIADPFADIQFAAAAGLEGDPQVIERMLSHRAIAG